MGKGKGIDPIAEAHERASHNINPYHWFNRISSYQRANWRINQMIAPLFFVGYSIIAVAMFNKVGELASAQNKSALSLLFDFSDSLTSARASGTFLFVIIWIILGVGTIQSILRAVFAPLPPKPIYKKEIKKKHPKRPKNYK